MMTEPTTPAPQPSAPADRDIRDRITHALLTTPRNGWTYEAGQEKWNHHGTSNAPGHDYAISCALCENDVDTLADAVLAVLPASTSPAPRVTSHTYEGDGSPCTAKAYGQTCGAPRDAHELDEGHAPLLPEREAEIREVRDGQLLGVILHPTRLGEALRDLLAELDRVRAERDRAVRAFESLAQKNDKAKTERDRYAAALTRLDQMATAWLEQLPEAIRTATAAEAVHYVVRSALHPLPGSATTRPARYEVSILPEADINYPVYALAVEYRGAGRWAVVRHGSCLGADGTWEFGVKPYDRDDAWLNAHRFDLETALRLAEEAAPKVIVNGITAAEVAARAAEGSDH